MQAMPKSSKRRDARVQRLKIALASVESSGRLSSTTMRSALTPEEWEAYKASAATCFGPALTKVERAEFAEYKRCLRRADVLHARAMRLGIVGKVVLRRNQLVGEADREYGRAWEILEQMLQQNPFVQALLDRPFEECTSACEVIARPVGSQSEFCGDRGTSNLQQLLRCQRAYLLSSLSRLRPDLSEHLAGTSTPFDSNSWTRLFDLAEA